MPYDGQFLIFNPIGNRNYQVNEIYKTEVREEYLVSHVGVWNEITGIGVQVNNFYDRRSDMNNTIFGVYTECSNDTIKAGVNNFK